MKAIKRTFIRAIAFLALGFQVHAHDSPSHVIDSLTHAMKKGGPTARLLTARAFEHRALGDWNAALADFAEALELQPRYDGALLGCAETLLSQGRLSEAESAARTAVAAAVLDVLASTKIVPPHP